VNDGSSLISREITGQRSDGESPGIKLADEILDAGARPILQALYAEGVK